VRIDQTPFLRACSFFTKLCIVLHSFIDNDVIILGLKVTLHVPLITFAPQTTFQVRRHIYMLHDVAIALCENTSIPVLIIYETDYALQKMLPWWRIK
jgi:hypothetical protein